MRPLCIGCNKRPDELEEYVDCAAEEGMTPDDYVSMFGAYQNWNTTACVA